jgi:hypothetical protein
MVAAKSDIQAGTNSLLDIVVFGRQCALTAGKLMSPGGKLPPLPAVRLMTRVGGDTVSGSGEAVSRSPAGRGRPSGRGGGIQRLFVFGELRGRELIFRNVTL